MADETLKVNTIRGMLYTVQPTASGTITRESDGKIILGFSANEQATFTGPGGYVICSDKTADIIENFKGALAIGAATGGSSGGEGGGITPAQEALLNGAAQKTAVNVFTMGNTFEGSVDFTGAVDLSEATVTFPADLELPGGEDGVSCTHSWNGTELIVASASGISSADLKGEKGEKGDTGAAGANGYDLIYTSGVPTAFVSSHVHDMGELAADTDLSAVAFTVNATKVQTCELWLSLGATAYTVTWPAGLVWLDGEPTLEAGKSYRFALRCEPNGKTIANVAYEYTA